MSDIINTQLTNMEDNSVTTTTASTDDTTNDNTDASYLSFSNPNYQFEDCLNSNNNNNLETSSLNDQPSHTTKKSDRKKYANLDLSELGIPPSPSSLTSPGTPSRDLILHKLNSPFSEEDNSEDESFENCLEEDLSEKSDLIPDKSEALKKSVANRLSEQPNSFMSYYTMLEAKARESAATNLDSPDSPDDDFELTEEDESTPMMINSITKKFDDNLGINSPDSNDSGIQSDSRSEAGTPHNNLDVDGTNGHKKRDDKTVKQKEDGVDGENDDQEEKLPTGWEKYDDEDGPYYWHIKSGTIQREIPSPSQGDSLRSGLNRDMSNQSLSSTPSTPTSLTSNTDDHLQEFEGHALQYAAKSLQNLCSQAPRDISLETTSGEKPIRYAVRSLGWVSIAEEDLTPDRSSKAVNKCIVDLSLGRNDINDVVGRWGDGKDLYMDLDCKSLRLVDTQDFSILNSQSIHSIRVWGVGRDNGRDFAYVARDKMSRRHMCHVFRCDNPARQIANTLRDICKKIMLERTLQQTTMKLNRPTDLPNLEKMGQPNGKLSFQSVNFPTPMEEPKKSIRCHYLGTEIVPKATGMEMLNTAVTRVYDRIPPERWHFVNVSIAPSTITITENGNPENKIDEIRVRFLSFMGIAMSNVKLCAFVVHTAQNMFVAHVFHCEPSGGPLCKTIEAACKLRYQKCMDAHPQSPKTPPSQGKPKLTITQALLPTGLTSTVKAGVNAGFQGVKAGVQGVKAGVQGVKVGVQGVSNLLSNWKNKRNEAS